MTEDKIPNPAREPAAAAGAARQRKKRKWDQPAEALISAGVALPGPLQIGMYGTSGISIPGVVPLSGGVLTNQVPATFNATSQITSVISHTADAAVQKLNQQKMQDELIAREIVINDAEPTIRYKLTKRQTQEEIQKSSGAVVITRGKYRPPNGLPDNEKPLYLHISAGSHLKDIAERIKAVDRAALVIEEILKQGHNSVPASTPFHPVSINGQMAPLLSTCVFLGFESDPSINIAARIRGPNDQYINHIMNETGATVVLRGRGSGTFESSLTEETQQPLHLYLSSINSRNLENAKILAENLMDTICAECGATRNTSSNIYGAVPPPQQLLTEVHSPPKVNDANGNLNVGLASTVTGSMPPAPVLASAGAAYSGALIQPGVLPGYAAPQANMVSYPYPSVTSGTCYNGYGGIYPQATPLQQVALALRQAPPSTFYVASTAPSTNTSTNTSSTSTSEMDKKSSQKRKFQELPVSLNGATVDQNLRQEEFLKSGPDDLGARNFSHMPPPKKLISPGSDGSSRPRPRNMPPPPPKFSEIHSLPRAESVNPIVKNSPPRNMPPPPPKFAAPRSPPKARSSDPIAVKSNSEALPDPLLKLMEYGEEEDDEIDAPGEDSTKNSTTWRSTPKPFWAP